MTKSKHVLDLSEMFEPTHSSYDYEEEMDLFTWGLVGAFVVLFIIGLAIADHFGLTVKL